MNSKQRRRLRKQKLPELINLLATKRITGELHPWINTGELIKAATHNPQRINTVMPTIEHGNYVDRWDFAATARTQLRETAMVAGRIPSWPSAQPPPKIYGKSIAKMILDDPFPSKHDDILDAIKYGFTQTFCTPEEVTGPRQENTGRL